jgi:hypothetical protein
MLVRGAEAILGKGIFSAMFTVMFTVPPMREREIRIDKLSQAGDLTAGYNRIVFADYQLKMPQQV